MNPTSGNKKAIDRRQLLALGVNLGIASFAGCALPGRGSSLSAEVGKVIDRHHPDYESWRRAMPWQGWVAPRYPDMIVRPGTASEAALAIQHARAQGLKVAVKSCGHNVSESFLRDEGMLLDLTLFKACKIDQANRSVAVGPALWGRNLMLELAKHQLAFPVAHCATVGMGGYLLGGGIGANTDVWGVGCHSVTGAEVVLADGQIRRINDQTDPDLMWAIRGAGTGFFGAITEYQLACKPLPKDIRETTYVFPFAAAPRVAEWFQRKAATGLTCTELMILLAHNPSASPSNGAADSKLCIARLVHFGDSEAENQNELSRILDDPLPEQALFNVAMQPSSIEQMMVGSVDAAMGLGFGRSAVNTVWTADSAATIASVMDTFQRAPSPKSHIVVSVRGNLELPADSCFSRLDRGFVGCYAVWDEADQDAVNFAWAEQMSAKLQIGSSGCYINELDAFNQPERLRQAFSEQSLERLSALRHRYDPDGLFFDFPGRT